MAIIEAISSKADIKTIIKYVTQDKKTNINLITGKDCLAESCLEEMLYTKKKWKEGDSAFSNMVIEVTIKQVVPLAKGQKVTG